MANDNDEPPGTETPPWLQPVGEPAAEGEDVSSLAPRVLMAGVAISVVILFGALVWFLYDQGDAGGAPVLVRAPEGPVKVEPVDRGGMDVPHRDKLVFNRVSGDRAAVDETLRPGAEEPLERPEVPALDSPVGTEDMADRIVGTGSVPEPPEPAADDPVAATASDEAPADGTVSAEDGRMARVSALPQDRWAVQIAAFRNEKDAASWMDDTVKQHGAIFDGLSAALVETHKDMATYYRVRFGSFPDRAAALAKCEEIKKVDLSCIVVAPE